MPMTPRAHAFAPRSVLRRHMIKVQLTPSEIYVLIEALEAQAERAAQCFDQTDFADYVFQRVAELRETAR